MKKHNQQEKPFIENDYKHRDPYLHDQYQLAHLLPYSPSSFSHSLGVNYLLEEAGKRTSRFGPLLVELPLVIH